MKNVYNLFVLTNGRVVAEVPVPVFAFAFTRKLTSREKKTADLTR